MDQDGEKTRAEPLHQKGLRLCILFRLVRTSLILTLFPHWLGWGILCGHCNKSAKTSKLYSILRLRAR
jgi:hypothetical protein